jgi:decaprenyl-phosphate phosphoribosyltransferase
MRPKQWIKNLLVASVPLAAGQLFERKIVWQLGLAFLVFVLASAGTYVFNDLRDADRDRQHPQKRHRPLACGDVKPTSAAWLGSILVILSLGLPIWAKEFELLGLIALYLGIQFFYQFGWKSVPIVEVFLVASGFVIRAVAGGAAAEIYPTPWFLSVVASGSLFVVSAKRFSESVAMGMSAKTRDVLIHYTDSYLRSLWTIALTCSIVFYALWAVEVQSTRESGMASSLLSVAPFSALLLRYAMFANEGKAESPEDLIVNDGLIRVLGVCWLATYWLHLI